jgi:drug/metabolite transporter (DMT)-like permease
VSARVAAAYVVVVLLWGSTWGAIKIGVAAVPAHIFAFERALAVAVILTGAAIILRQPFPRSGRAILACVIAGLLNIGAAWAVIFWAEQFVPSGLVAVFGAMAPVWTAVLAHFFVRGDRLSVLKIGALGLGIGGTALLVGAPTASEGPNVLLAMVLLALMPIGWGIAAILVARYLKEESPIAVVGLQTSVAAVFLAPFAFAQLGLPQHWDGPAALAFAYLVIGGTCIGLVLNMWLFRHLRPTTVMLSQILVPAQALLIGGFVFGEAFDVRMLAGAALVVGAVALNAKSGASSHVAPVAEPSAID